jgi:hypothetical protein
MGLACPGGETLKRWERFATQDEHCVPIAPAHYIASWRGAALPPVIEAVAKNFATPHPSTRRRRQVSPSLALAASALWLTWRGRRWPLMAAIALTPGKCCPCPPTAPPGLGMPFGRAALFQVPFQTAVGSMIGDLAVGWAFLPPGRSPDDRSVWRTVVLTAPWVKLSGPA